MRTSSVICFCIISPYATRECKKVIKIDENS